MQELKCPNCGKVFQVDDAGYAQIVQQVRDEEFRKELDRREQDLKKLNESELEREQMKLDSIHKGEIAKKESAIADKDLEIERLKAQLEKAETEKELAVSKAVQEKEKELSEKGTEITQLKSRLDLEKKEREIQEKSLEEQHREALRLRDEEIERYKDFKAKLSTKMVGESLEQHCQAEFNRIRTTAFPNAYFAKDNDASSGSKGDFIFKEKSGDTEIISIMFDMKNEMDTTGTKHKNEDFFKELDKDRREKHCEYAVLVSLLESDSELYNSGIVDVSYAYPKMYVIRPQFFIPMISLLRNAALNATKYRKELEEIKARELDFSNFENNLLVFKNGFTKNLDLAKKKHEAAVTEIEKAIDLLTKIKEDLQLSDKHLNAANNKVEDISIKKLTKNAPAVKAILEDLRGKEG